MIEIESRLQAFVEETARQPVVWGENDCSAWPAQWVQVFHGRPLRLPQWRTREEAHALISEAGSLACLWARVLSDFGLLPRYGMPQAGDVGILETRVSGQVGVIFIHDALVAWRGEPVGFGLLRPRQHSIIRVWALS